MPSQPTIPTQKIVFLCAFICTALMASVLVYHMRYKETTPIISSDLGTIYSASRDIKEFKLIAGENHKFTTQQLYGHWTLLFFGFSHCAEVCPNTLQSIEKVYLKLKPKYPNLQVVMISLDPERDKPSQLMQYVQSFHGDFIGATGKVSELRKLQSQFGIYAARDSSTGDDYQITHTTTINLINPKGKWAGLFHYGINPNTFAEALDQSIRKLS